MHILMRVVLLIRTYVARSARWRRTVKTDAHARARRNSAKSVFTAVAVVVSTKLVRLDILYRLAN